MKTTLLRNLSTKKNLPPYQSATLSNRPSKSAHHVKLPQFAMCHREKAHACSQRHVQISNHSLKKMCSIVRLCSHCLKKCRL